MYQGLIAQYQSYLPAPTRDAWVSLNEGNTPLIKLDRLLKQLGIECDCFVKFEGLNPTGSFKDRGMTLAVSHAVASQSQTIICASTGNTSASAAAYAARAGLKAIVLIPEGNIALGKLAQAMMHGALVLQIQGNFDDGLKIVRQLGEQFPVTIVNSINPYRIAGQKTIAFEIVDALERAPDYHYLPVGNAGNISAHWQGYQLYQQHKSFKKLPIMVGYQASGAAPFVHKHFIDTPETIATAMRIGAPASWDMAWQAVEQSGGWFDCVDDPTLLEAQQLLAKYEGIFCEPASAASIAGMIADYKQGKLPAGSTVVCTLTGNGLKDPDIVIKHLPKPTRVAANVSDIAKYLSC